MSELLPQVPAENIYGHVKRLHWIASRLRPEDRVLEIGCGTGFMITIPLIQAGWDVIGVDTDSASIEYGQRIMSAEGLDPHSLRSVMAEELEGPFEAVILSEVLEHMQTEAICALLRTTRALLAPGGQLFVTVPNGYGAFEVEAFVWNRLGLGWILSKSRLQYAIERLKMHFATSEIVHPHPSSLDSSPHVQRFTLSSVARMLEVGGFKVAERSGTVLFAGPISNILFTGVKWVMSLDARLGDLFPAVATAFMLRALAARDEQ